MPQMLLSGPWAQEKPLPISFQAVLCDLERRFIAKGSAGSGYRAVARNGRVLLASHVPVTQLDGQIAEVRVQIWHKAILPNDPPLPYGLLLCIRNLDCTQGRAVLRTRLVAERRLDAPDALCLRIEVGGGQVLEFVES
jgi:hypothetical protein